MNTYIICTSPLGNTVSNYFFLISKALVKRGHKVILVIDKQKHYDNDPLCPNLIYYSWPSRRPTRFKDFIYFYKLCKTHHPDVTLGQFGSTNIVLIVSFLLGIKNRIVYWHTMQKQTLQDSNISSIKHYLLNLRKRFILNFFSTHILTNSNATKEDIISNYKLFPKKISVFPFLISDYFKDKPILNKSHREQAIAFVGRLDHSKGHVAFIHQLPEVFKKFPKLKVYIIGEGKLRPTLVALCNNLNIDKQVEFTSSVSLEKVYDYLNLSLVHVSASVEEAFGLVNVEALMAGTPIIANKVGGITDILIPDENGLFFEPNKKGSLFFCLDNIIGGNWEHFSEQARQSFLNRYLDSEQNLNKQLDILDQMLNIKML